MWTQAPLPQDMSAQLTLAHPSKPCWDVPPLWKLAYVPFSTDGSLGMGTGERGLVGKDGCWLSSLLWAWHHRSDPHPLPEMGSAASPLVDEKNRGMERFLKVTEREAADARSEPQAVTPGHHTLLPTERIGGLAP